MTELKAVCDMVDEQILAAFDKVLKAELGVQGKSCAYEPELLLKAVVQLRVSPLWEEDMNQWYADCTDKDGENHRGIHKQFNLAVASAVVKAYYADSGEMKTPKRRRRRA